MKFSFPFLPIRVISDEIKGTLIVNGKNYVVEPKKEIEVAI